MQKEGVLMISTNPNRGHWSPPQLVTHATEHQADISRRGELVRAPHPSGRVDDFEICSTWTSSYTGAPMVTLMRVGGGFSFDVRADEVEGGVL
jgi:hypothetical protein